MRKTLFITDLDGTLLSSDSRVSPSSAAMLNEAIASGALFSVATARTPSTVASLLAEVNASLPFIVMTGSAEWNPADGKFSHPTEIAPEESEAIISTLRRHSLPAFIYMLRGDVIHIFHTGPLSDMEKEFIAERDDSRYKVFHIHADGESDLPSPLSGVTLFYTMATSPNVADAYREILRDRNCTPLYYHDIYGPETGIMEIFSPEASKANALKRLRKNIGADRVVAFGDNINDIPMLREADIAVAVENALPEVKEAADIVIGPNTSDSVARFILEATQDPSMLDAIRQQTTKN